MVFVSPVFLFLFLPLTILGYYFMHPKLKNVWLFLMSFIFYSWGGLAYSLLFLFSSYINFLFGIWMEKSNNKKLILIISIIWNLGILMFFKYTFFLLYNIQRIVRIFNSDFVMNIPKITLPIGISFFTFQIMTYVIDLYRKEIKVQKKFINLGLYIFLFPQLIAGPIVRYIDVENEINNRKIDFEMINYGIKRFISGLFKKMLIANTMGIWADTVFNTSWENMSTPLAWLGIFGYTMQIFFDFSAYSDMAIGLGKIFGFNFLENFNYPYISKNVQEFWRRWHISLSTWFKDYLYIPLGGSYRGKKRTYINLIIVFFLTGLWHGAAWNFVFWGLFHGFFLILERVGLNKILEKIPRFFQHFYTLTVVAIGWVFFRSENFLKALIYIKRLFFINFDHLEYFFLELENWKLFIGFCAIILSTPIFPYLKERMIKKVDNVKYEIFESIVYILLFLISLMFIAGSSFNPFIYFQF